MTFIRYKICRINWDQPDNAVLLGHAAGSQSQASGDDSGQTFRDSSDGESNGDLEIVDGTLHPGSTVSGVVEVTDVDGPDSDTDEGDDLGQLLSEFVELLLEWGLDFFSLDHFGTNAADGGVQAGTDNNTAGLNKKNIVNLIPGENDCGKSIFFITYKSYLLKRKIFSFVHAIAL